MTAGQAQVPESGSIRSQLVGRQQFRREALFPEQLAHQSECRPLVAAALNQHVENLALMIDSAPQVHLPAGDPDHHLVEVPPVAWARAALPQVPRDPGPELQNPPPHRLIGDIEAAFSEELFHVAVAQCEPEIKPNRMLDDRRRKAMAAIREMDHARTLSDRLLLSDPGFRDIAAATDGQAGGGEPEETRSRP